MGKLNSTRERIDWLGPTHDPDYFKYIYLTEPDTILNINHSILPLIKNALDDGINLFPHRLHPLPHETDLPKNIKFNRGLYLPNNPPFDKVISLDHTKGGRYISCCDNGLSAPANDNWVTIRKINPEKRLNDNLGCEGKRWWECGFYEHDDSNGNFNLTKFIEGHARLSTYRFMRLRNGIGLAFGTNNQGRKCIPSKRACDE